jgi:hypothetical protein
LHPEDLVGALRMAVYHLIGIPRPERLRSRYVHLKRKISPICCVSLARVTTLLETYTSLESRRSVELDLASPEGY